mmetsp:Transcript_32382/g.57285  ORF Transcript_32382/g.57285 Transcript_32382/m.57285 type:complete len:194 (-) Transcript_32382:58-639(-)
MALNERSTSEDHDWASGWDSDPTGRAAPRYTVGNSDQSKNRKKDKNRDTYICKHARSVSWVPGPGTHKTRRNFDPYPEDDPPTEDSPFNAREKREPRWQDVVDRKCYYQIPKAVRQASLPNLRTVRPTLLPTSHHTPGPGSYTAYSSFGASSGGSRKRYFATNKADNLGFAREKEEYKRETVRGFDERFVQTR